jgi:hypothetical protein
VPWATLVVESQIPLTGQRVHRGKHHNQFQADR